MPSGLKGQRGPNQNQAGPNENQAVSLDLIKYVLDSLWLDFEQKKNLVLRQKAISL